VDLQWGTSPSAALRDVEYAVLRRASGVSTFAEIARTIAVTYTDAPAHGTYDYVVRAVVSTFTSTDSPVATATTGP
jgi:hypothetical protein